MFRAFRNICRSDIDDGTTNSFGRRDDDVVILGDLECIERFASGSLVENAHIDGVRNGVVYEFAEDETVTAFIEELHGISGDWDAFSYVGIVFHDLQTM